ncbi:hypothetical protein KFK09_010204 [Dendrobium nobile]|uniref:Uncharacterized protein n=1 Tax=Dendrobium nobile TaxID=94219 RepID=A0A8T3BN90_DENNO|nr:hypothetical protein KFK09_010204 [Dendrobium nobile]
MAMKVPFTQHFSPSTFELFLRITFAKTFINQPSNLVVAVVTMHLGWKLLDDVPLAKPMACLRECNFYSPRHCLILDEEISERKQACYADIDSGLWGTQCRSTLIEKENCALKCTSAVCYELIYGSDPLEEGERDYIRSQEYRYCMRRSSVGLTLDQVKGAFDNDVTVRPAAFSLPGSVRITH